MTVWFVATFSTDGKRHCPDPPVRSRTVRANRFGFGHKTVDDDPEKSQNQLSGRNHPLLGVKR